MIREKQFSRDVGEALENLGAADWLGFFTGLNGAEHGRIFQTFLHGGAQQILPFFEDFGDGILEQYFEAALFSHSHAGNVTRFEMRGNTECRFLISGKARRADIFVELGFKENLSSVGATWWPSAKTMPPRQGWIGFWIWFLKRCRAYGAEVCFDARPHPDLLPRGEGTRGHVGWFITGISQIQRRVFSRRRKQQSPLLGQRVWVMEDNLNLELSSGCFQKS